MLVLALDTTGRAGSLALFRDRHPLAVRVGDARRTHGQRLPGDLVSLLDEHGLQPRDVDLFAVAAGPGSFTGLRVGIATIQGLALVTGRPVVAVSALEALAYAVRERAGDRLIGAWIDAQRREVFGALYEPVRTPETPDADPSLGLAERAAPSVGTADQILERWVEPAGHAPVLFAGDGAHLYRGAILQVRHASLVEVLAETPPLAAALANIAMTRAAEGRAGRPHAIVPVYVRRPDAELAREKREPS